MKKINILLRVMSLVLMLTLVVCSPVFADISMNFPSSSGQITQVNTSVSKIWGTVTFIVQILAFAAVVFAGLRYMFSSADQKADIKKSLGILALGAILVFAAATVVQFINNAAGEILK